MSTLADLQKALAQLHGQRTSVERDILHARARAQAPSAAQSRAQRAGLVAQENGLRAQLGDPRHVIEQLDDAVPFLLFPLRVETRFMPAKSQLWVRIFPDDCQVQTSTDVMTTTELADVRSFWCDTWKAGGVEGQRRAAWRALVLGHGSGRSAWLVKTHAPTGSPPAKAHPDDIILVVNPSVTLTPDEQTAATKFWIAFWRADKDAFAQKAARTALLAAVGDARAHVIESKWAPVNLADSPPIPQTRDNATVTVATIALPPTDGLTTSPVSWQQAPRVSTLPDCFVVTGIQGGKTVFSTVGKPTPSTLAVGPDPSLPDDEQIKSADGELKLNAELSWLTDFEQAVASGMALKIDLTAAQLAAGFDRLLVLGVRLSADAAQGAQLLQALLADHRTSKSGFSILPQGTPTNNTEDSPSGYTWVDDPDGSYDLVFGHAASFPLANDPLAKRDGQSLAESLGIDVATLAGVPHADGLDQAHARAINTALWPATWGYFFEEMLRPLVTADTIEKTRSFFVRHVSGRGVVPAIRIGKQPYGILPTTAHSRLDFIDHRPVRAPIHLPAMAATPAVAAVARVPHLPVPVVAADPWTPTFMNDLQKQIRKVDTDFASARGQVAFVGKPGDPLQTLLDVIGLHPSSVELYQRWAESVAQAYNEFSLQVGPFFAGLLLGALQDVRKQVVQGVGLDPAANPPILDKIFHDSATLLDGPVVDDVPLSETAPIRIYSADGKNYLDWLALSPLEAIRQEDFGGKSSPSALLYLVLRQGLMLSYWDAAVRLMVSAKLLDDAKARMEPDFLAVGAQVDGVSKWQHLYSAQPAITGDPHLSLGEYLDRPAVWRTSPAAARLAEVKTALASLSQASTASLERLFAEHIDTCTYRIDAWKQSLVHRKLEILREQQPSGVYLGAFGWLENLRPENVTLAQAQVPADLKPIFGGAPIVHDPTNAGYVHAPSLDHATTAAILKSAYLSHATPANPGLMSVNLTSERVRLAMALLEGLRRGQGLAELLGYQFERGLHDRHQLDGTESERFLYGLRCQFPLTANKLAATKAPPGTPVEQLEARNVVDGLALIERVRATGNPHYPFGLSTGSGPSDLPAASAAEAAAIDDEVQRLEDAQDALADLMTAESVYHAVRGQSERAAAATDVIGKGHFPPEPEVVRTPRSGTNLTHRVALHFDATAKPAAAATPRAIAEPALDAWLSARLPSPSDLSCAVKWTDPVSGPHAAVVTLAALGLRPIDLLFIGVLDGQSAMTELDDRIEEHVRSTLATHPGATVSIEYTQSIPGKPTLFEVGALVRELNTLVLSSRPLAATGPALSPQKASADPRWDLVELAARVSTVRSALSTALAPLQALAADNASAPEDFLAQAVARHLDIARFGVPQTGTGDWRARVVALYQSIVKRLQVVLARWDAQRTECAALLASLPSLATDDARTLALVRAERLVSTTVTAPRPDVATYQAIVSSAMASFDGARAALAAPLSAGFTRLADLIAQLEPALAAIPLHDAVPFDTDARRNDLSIEKAALLTLRDETRARVDAVVNDVQARLAAASDAITKANGSSDPKKALSFLTDAARQVLGDAVCVLPRFTLGVEQAGEVKSAYAASTTLLAGLTARAFPVDDWLYGAARVRPKLAHWEKAILVAEAFGAASAELTPLQFPYQDGDRWAALELPDGYTLAGEKLLYTASFAQPLDTTQPMCGVVLDEWTEIVPGKEETTGIAFHFDTPTAEPPQALLLAVTPQQTGAWKWQDLLDTLGETLEQAKLRAIEPSQIAGSLYSQFLPATIMAVTQHPITIGTNLGNNKRAT